MSSMTSLPFIPGYGLEPSVTISHSSTPNAHTSDFVLQHSEHRAENRYWTVFVDSRYFLMLFTGLTGSIPKITSVGQRRYFGAFSIQSLHYLASALAPGNNISLQKLSTVYHQSSRCWEEVLYPHRTRIGIRPCNELPLKYHSFKANANSWPAINKL